MKILVVDDTPAALDLLAAIAVGDGHEVLTASTGKTALAIAEREQPDLVLLDVMMPAMSGYEVCQRLRMSPATKEVAILMVTALADRQTRLRAFEAGADGFLPKPVDRMELTLRLRSAARLKRYRSLLAQRSELEDLSRLSPDALVSLDARGQVLSGNPRASALFGGLVGRPAHALLSPRDADALEAALATLSETDASTTRLEARMAGDDMPVEVVLQRASVHSAPVHALMVVRDLSERERVLARLEVADRHAIVARATSEVAHDLTNTLVAVQGAIFSACDRPGVDDVARAALDEALELIQNAGDTIRRMSAMTSPQPRRPTTFEMNGELTAMAPLLRRLARHAALGLHLTESPMLVHMSLVDFQQAVMNLVSNAADAIPSSQAGGTITVETRRLTDAAASSDLAWRLSVRDNGLGMSVEVAEKAFEAFFTTKPQHLGSGLGLHLVRQTVERGGGVVGLETATGAGTTVHLDLPEAVASDINDELEAFLEETHAGPHRDR